MGAALLAGGCSGTDNGGTGDPPSDPSSSKLGTGSRLSELLGPATWLEEGNMDSVGCAAPTDRTVHVTGVTVVAIDRYDETSEGQLGNYYVQDTALEPLPYSGVTVFSPSFSPPDLRLAEGDVADMNGVLMEFLGPSSGPFGDCKTLPEVGGTLSFRLENGTRVAATISIDDLKSYDTARQWLGMLVRLENARISVVSPSSGGRYTPSLDVGDGVPASDVPKLSNELYDLEGEGPPLSVGQEFKSITGVVTYFYGFKLAPRSPDDFEPL
jgi:hypothetical protein